MAIEGDNREENDDGECFFISASELLAANYIANSIRNMRDLPCSCGGNHDMNECNCVGCRVYGYQINKLLWFIEQNGLSRFSAMDFAGMDIPNQEEGSG